MKQVANTSFQGPHVPVGVAQDLARALRDYKPLPDFADRLLSEDRSYCVPVSANAIPIPGLAYYLLVHILRFPYVGRLEKVAWGVPFIYQDRISCCLVHEKFGLRLYLDASQTIDSDATRLAEAIIGRLSRALRVVDMRVLQEFAQERLAGGFVTVKNQFLELNNRYVFFRQEAARHFQLVARDSPHNSVESFARSLETGQHAYYYTIAMLDAYFSRLEHFLVLAPAFADFDPANDDLKKLIAASWSDKYARVFDISSADANMFFRRLHDLKKRYRNTFAHGGFDKEGATLGFHLPGVGAIPAQLSAVRGSPHFRFIPVAEPDFNTACELFDRFDGWVDSGDCRYALRYARSGLDVPFDAASLVDHRRAMASDADFEAFLDERSYSWEMERNMDY